MQSIQFLTVQDLMALHDIALRVSPNEPTHVLNAAALTSCVESPKATFGGEFLYSDLFEMAAAYGYFIALNHPFMAANKRVAALAPLTFLRLNEVQITVDNRIYERLILELIAHTLTREELAAYLRGLVA